MTLRSAFVKTVTDLMDERADVVLCMGDISCFAFTPVFKRHPTRCYNLGICEGASVDLCAGLAMSGLYPIYHTIDSFMVYRAFESVLIGFGYQKLPGMFVGVGGSSDYAKLGPTHRCEHGTTLMAQIPGMHIRMPITEATVDLAIRSAIDKRQLSYIRLEESLAVADGDQPPRPRLHLKLGASNGHAIDPGAQR